MSSFLRLTILPSRVWGMCRWLPMCKRTCKPSFPPLRHIIVRPRVVSFSSNGRCCVRSTHLLKTSTHVPMQPCTTGGKQCSFIPRRRSLLFQKKIFTFVQAKHSTSVLKLTPVRSSLFLIKIFLTNLSLLQLKDSISQNNDSKNNTSFRTGVPCSCGSRYITKIIGIIE